jgi:hypothetical protein
MLNKPVYTVVILGIILFSSGVGRLCRRDMGGKSVLNHLLKQIVARLHILLTSSLEELKLGWTMVLKLKVDLEIPL